MKPSILDNNKLFEIYKKEDVSFLGVFGSFVRGTNTEQSDIDLIVRFSKAKSLMDLVRIEREFTSVLGTKVDLLTESSISPYLRNRIIDEMEVVYERKG